MKNNLRNLREKKRYTLREVAEKTGISYVVLSRMELCNQDIQEGYARILADFYKVSIDYLFGREENETRAQVIYKDAPVSFQTIMTSLKKLNNNELSRLFGAIEMIIDARNTSPNSSVAESIITANMEKHIHNK